jgi:hypothetical protein
VTLTPNIAALTLPAKESATIVVIQKVFFMLAPKLANYILALILTQSAFSQAQTLTQMKLLGGCWCLTY